MDGNEGSLDYAICEDLVLSQTDPANQWSSVHAHTHIHNHTHRVNPLPGLGKLATVWVSPKENQAWFCEGGFGGRAGAKVKGGWVGDWSVVIIVVSFFSPLASVTGCKLSRTFQRVNIACSRATPVSAADAIAARPPVSLWQVFPLFILIHMPASSPLITFLSRVQLDRGGEGEPSQGQLHSNLYFLFHSLLPCTN